jgi:biopolymer transport protein ExbD/biopolymer transport protein TolR
MAVSRHRLNKIRAAARHPKKREKGNVKADINVTPLVDVVLVLLIIFMVVTPMIAKGVAVDLPKTAHHDRKPDDGKDIIVSVTKDELIYVAGNRAPKDQVTKLIGDEKRRYPEKTIYVKADSRVKYGFAREVLELIHKADIDDIMLGTDEIKTTEAH